jgi:hypothetical protein
MAYSNAAVAQMQREAASATLTLIAEVRALRAEVSRLSTPTGAPVAIPAAQPVVTAEPSIVEPTAKGATKLRCAGGVSKACEREFGSVANLAAHNAWAHKG